MMGVKVVTAPTVEPVTVTEAKLQLRVDHSTDDTDIASLIVAARAECEHELGRSIASQTRQLDLDAFPADDIPLHYTPAASITSIKYVDTNGTLQTLSASAYELLADDNSARVRRVYGSSWPDTRAEIGAVRVLYVAGYTTCPEPIRRWILLRVGTLYHTREADSDKPAMPSPFVDRHIDRYRVY